MIIGWLSTVNRKILDSTSINVGKGGYVEDKADNSAWSDRRLTSYIVPEVYSVTMDFDWIVKDENNMTEYDRFVQWFNYKHRRGVNPFNFPSIKKDLDDDGNIKTCQYKITSELNASKSGFCMRVTMTWEEYYSGSISIPDFSNQIDHIVVTNGQLEVIYIEPIDESNLTNVTLSYGNSSQSRQDNDVTLEQNSVEGSSVYYDFEKIPASTQSAVYYFLINGDSSRKKDADGHYITSGSPEDMFYSGCWTNLKVPALTDEA